MSKTTRIGRRQLKPYNPAQNRSAVLSVQSITTAQGIFFFTYFTYLKRF